MNALEVYNISKKYNISRQGGKYLVLRDKIKSYLSALLPLTGKKKRDNKTFCALNNISFSVKKGSAFGIIGSNGAGKSTLLKILARVTRPSSGKIIMNGKIASMLEVGAGFHPELTGRENIFLSGVLLGMPRREIEKKFKQIVEFSGVEQFIDMPVKRYSSGMYVRLAFSVMAHLDAEILIIDEVLAVGDFDFQRKCLNKMIEAVGEKKQTIIFVSHDLNAIKYLCDTCMLVDGGEIKSIGSPEDVIHKYLSVSAVNSKESLEKRVDRKGLGKIKVEGISITNQDGILNISSGDKLSILIKYKNTYGKNVNYIKISLVVYNYNNSPLLRFDTDLTKNSIKTLREKGAVICKTENINLGAGNYYLNIGIWVGGVLEDFVDNAIDFEIKNNKYLYNFSGNQDVRTDQVLVPHSFLEID